MKQTNINRSQLKDFIDFHKLSDRHSIINFNSIVTIRTAENKITNRPMEIMVTFDGYDNPGKLTFQENDLDPCEYPTVFLAKWQKMEHVDNEYLRISGHHGANPKIGRYEIKIVPLEKLKE